jgi:phosphoglycerol transferase MdoB-like AlkP superfamily enzyme
MVIILGFCLIGARGGIQLRPLSMMHATTSGPAKQIPIILNTPFTLMTTFGHGNINDYKFFEESRLKQYYNVIKSKSKSRGFNNKNVIIILLESFSKEYVGSLNNYKGYTPFLDSLLSNSLAFTNAFSSGYRSMDAIPTAVTSIPCLIDDPIITSVYGNNKYTSLANLLKGKSYETAFFHGGTNGTLGLDGFVKFLGFEKYYGRKEYGNDDDYDNYWGIYDEPFLQFMIRKIDEMKEPFFAMEFTLSSHYPYSLPKKYEKTFKEGPLRIHRVVSYTDNALRKFFEKAKEKKWFKNTIFIISADHPAQSVIPGTKGNINDADNLPDNSLLKYYKNTSGRYAIPILIYEPGDSSLNGVVDEVFQQSDIMPTILDLLNYDGNYVAFGNSAFDTTSAHAAFHYVNGLYQITYRDYCLLFNGIEPTALYLKSDIGHSNNLLDKETGVALKLENILKAYLQEYSQRMRKNDLLIEAK